MITFLTLVSLLLSLMIEQRCALGRPPERIDHTACHVQMHDKLDKFQEMEDPNASVLAYFNQTGYPCKTYCKLRSANKNVDKITMIIDSPYYIICGKDRFCSKGGKCKRIGTPLKLKDDNEVNEDELKNNGVTPVVMTKPPFSSPADDGASSSTLTNSGVTQETLDSNDKTSPTPDPEVSTEAKGKKNNKG